MLPPRFNSKESVRFREASKLSDGLEKRLLTYAIAATAAGGGLFAAPQPAYGEISFTRNKVVLTNGSLSIDLNHDGTADLILSDTGSGNTCCFYERALDVTGNAGGAVVGAHRQAAVLPRGAEIGAGRHFVSTRALMASASNDSNSFLFIRGRFANVTNQFLGVRFTISGQTHFGWVGFARVTPSFPDGEHPAVSAVLAGFAYETIPNKPILTGAIGGQSGDVADLSGRNTTSAEASNLGLLALGSAGLPAWRRRQRTAATV
jgi:hypothetical protein